MPAYQMAQYQKQIKYRAYRPQNHQEVANKPDEGNSRLCGTFFPPVQMDNPVRMRQQISACKKETTGDKNSNNVIHDDVHAGALSNDAMSPLV
jgi:hypothetical protein